MDYAKNIGLTRNEEAKRMGKPSLRFSQKYSDEQIHIIGAIGELVFCKSIDCYFYPTLNSFKKPDVGANIQVRTTTSSYPKLRIQNNDKRNELYVLVYKKDDVWDTWYVAGWMQGNDGMKPEYLKDNHYYVPYNHLNTNMTIFSYQRTC